MYKATQTYGTVCDDKEFWSAFIKDVENARCRVIIESPFIVRKRLNDLEGPFKRAIARGVAVCIFIQEPSEWTKAPEGSKQETLASEELRLFVARLLSWGVHVTIRRRRHVKIVIVDSNILWDGSLNVLAHFTAGERMRRYDTIEEVNAAITKERLFECTQCRKNVMNYTVDNRANNQVAAWGKLFKDRRETMCLSQRDIVENSGIAKSLVSRLEKGQAPLFETTVRAHTVVGRRIFSLPEHIVPAVGNFLAKIEPR